MSVFHLPDVLAAQVQSGRAYLEFLRVPALSMGVYRLPAGAADPQRPHNQDEVYCVLAGRGQLRVKAEDHPVGPGFLAFVARGVEHRFHSLTEDLTALVFFAPAESEEAPGPPAGP
jgi:mannose-6-phosphate isomerase-like protein (cupin superfamily)